MATNKRLHRFDTGFVPTGKSDRDAIIVTRNSPLISVVSRTRAGEYRIWGGSFIGGGGCREASVDEAAPTAGLARRAPRAWKAMKLQMPRKASGSLICKLVNRKKQV